MLHFGPGSIVQTEPGVGSANVPRQDLFDRISFSHGGQERSTS